MASISSGYKSAVTGAAGNMNETIQETARGSASISSSDRNVPETDQQQPSTGDDGHDSDVSHNSTPPDPTNSETSPAGDLDSAIPPNTMEQDGSGSNIAENPDRQPHVEEPEAGQLEDITLEHHSISPAAGRSASSPPSVAIAEDRALPEVPVAFPARTSSRRSPAGESNNTASVHGMASLTRRTSSGTGSRGSGSRSSAQDFALPRWQPDVEVTYCPICRTQFSIFVRKHHCRKCGRVVCNSCSPHRIIIPHQYIVRPPGSEFNLTPNLIIDGLGVGYVDVNGASGGERVRLCNPCVPDPNTAPPQSPSNPALSPRSPHQRSRSTLSGSFGSSTYSRYGVPPGPGQSTNLASNHGSRSRSITMGPADQDPSGNLTNVGRTSMSYQTSLGRFLALGPPAASSSSQRNRRSFNADSASSSRQRALPPTPQIAEEDECPICHRELPAQSLPEFEALREAHITSCIQAHSTYGSPRHVTSDATPAAAPRRTGMYTYMATEKDCVDDAECTICLEEYQVNDPMCRLECLCRFHRSCITLWFVNHPGRCPVHQHDGFGY